MRALLPWPQGLTWAELEEDASAPFAELDEREGAMTEDRYASAATVDTAVNARRFLAATLSLNRLFAGTGYTQQERPPEPEAAAGDGGGTPAAATAEYFTENFLLSSIPPCQMIELPP